MPRYTNIDLTKAALMRDGRIDAFDAVYNFTDPDGKPHRNTRLAATIHTLRHRYGWPIETVSNGPGKLDSYVLTGTPPVHMAGKVYAGRPPKFVGTGEGNVHLGRPLMGIPEVIVIPNLTYRCSVCHRPLQDVTVTAFDDRFGTGRCVATPACFKANPQSVRKT